MYIFKYDINTYTFTDKWNAKISIMVDEINNGPLIHRKHVHRSFSQLKRSGKQSVQPLPSPSLLRLS